MGVTNVGINVKMNVPIVLKVFAINVRLDIFLISLINSVLLFAVIS